MKILWLCSWYPHRGNPYEGDFIQRHAKALSLFSPVTVFYVSQDGIAQNVETTEVIDQQINEVREKIIFFRFKKTGISIIDKLVYNLKYFSTYKKYIRQYIVTEGKPDIVHIHVPMKAGIIGRWLKKNWKIPYIISEHSSHYNGGTDDDFFNKSIRHQNMVKKIFFDAIAVTNVSAAIGNKLKSLFGLKDIKVIPNTVDTSLFFLKVHEPAKFRFIHVSTLAPYQKNIAGILNAITGLSKQRQDFELIMVGPAGDELKKKVVESGMDPFVKFTGEITYPEVAKQMQQASALVLFSRYENFPCVIIEALCCGLPVIATDTGGVREAVNNENGILIESGNEGQLVDALNRLMNTYHQYDRRKIATDASMQYSYETIGSAFNNLYKEVVKIKANK
jgi:glycosyltransferase involved in cell wall biosynthesis